MDIIKNISNKEQSLIYKIYERYLKLPDSEETEILYQYTSIDALFNGIINKNQENEAKSICLWASNIEYMNDPKEVACGISLVDEFFHMNAKNYLTLIEQFIVINGIEKLDESKKTICKLHKVQIESLNGYCTIEKLIEYCREYINAYEKTMLVPKEFINIFNRDSFITSFSTNIDSLPMWSMYGKNGSGIALGFDRNILKSLYKDQILKCIYCDKEVSKLILDGIFDHNNVQHTSSELLNPEQMVEMDDKIFMRFMTKVIFFTKNPAYKYEEEIRLHIVEEENVKYRCQSNLIIPYVENYLPKQALKEIWVGPTTNMTRTIKSIYAYLSHLGFDMERVKIKPSKVLYRA